MLGKTVSAPDAQLKQDIQLLCGQYAQYNSFDPELFSKFAVKRGLRNADGTGVLAGISCFAAACDDSDSGVCTSVSCTSAACGGAEDVRAVPACSCIPPFSAINGIKNIAAANTTPANRLYRIALPPLFLKEYVSNPAFCLNILLTLRRLGDTIEYGKYS